MGFIFFAFNKPEALLFHHVNLCNELSVLVSMSFTTAARCKFLWKNISFFFRHFYASTLRGGMSFFQQQFYFVNETISFIVYTTLAFYLII